MDLGYGIPDIVVVQYKKKKRLQRQDFLNYFDISVLDLIEKKKSVTVDDIVYLTRSAKKKIDGSLSLLQNEKLIVYREGKYFSHKKYAEALEDSIAIEAKLKNWKRALEQAYRYKWFSSKSYVMLPANNMKPALDNIELFKKYEVGLASLSTETGIEIHYKPKSTAPYSPKMYKLLNERVFTSLATE
jgi:predicted transcriptional regulator